jgi:hypothetical protein
MLLGAVEQSEHAAYLFAPSSDGRAIDVGRSSQLLWRRYTP